MTSGAPAELDALAGRLQALVRIVGAIIKPVATAGLLAALVVGLALIPWLLHSTPAVVCYVVIVGGCVAARVRLFWHRRLLQRTLGSPAFVRDWFDSTTRVGAEQVRPLADQLDDVLHADRGTKVRAALRMLASVRNLKAMRAIGDAANAIVEPIAPGRLAMTGYAAIVVGVAVVAAIPIMFGSLVGLALR